MFVILAVEHAASAWFGHSNVLSPAVLLSFDNKTVRLGEYTVITVSPVHVVLKPHVPAVSVSPVLRKMRQPALF